MDKTKKWYMVTVVSGYENDVKTYLQNKIAADQKVAEFGKIEIMWIPYYTNREMEKKQKDQTYNPKSRQKNLYPGYIFINMKMTNETWYLVRNTQYVTGLVGSSGKGTKPTPVSEIEMRKVWKNVKKLKDDFGVGKVNSNIKVGSIAEVVNGSAKGLIGKVIEVDEDRRTAIIELIIFERKTPTEIEFKDLEVK